MCQSVPVFQEEDRSFDIDDPTEPSNTVKDRAPEYSSFLERSTLYLVCTYL